MIDEIYNKDDGDEVRDKLNDFISNSEEVPNKIVKQPGATVGNVAAWDASGNLIDIGVQPGGGEGTNIPLWVVSITYPLDFVVSYNDKLYSSQTGGNLGNEPGTGSEWSEVSESSAKVVPPWTAGVYSTIDSRVFVIDSESNLLDYVLVNTNLPFESIDFDLELSAGDWERVGYDKGEGSILSTSTYRNPLEGVVTGIGSVGVKSIDTNDTSTYKWQGACFVPGVGIFCAPSGSPNILIIDTYSDTYTLTGDFGTSGNKYHSCCFDPVSGKVYFIPASATQILVLDTLDNSTYLFADFSGTLKWRASVLAPNGKIYCPPYDNSSILVIDPIDDSTTEINVSEVTTGSLWCTITLAPNGKLYCAPRSSTGVLVIDPTDDSYYIFNYLSDANQYTCSCLGIDGKIYCPPLSANSFMIIDPIDDSITYDYSISGSTKFWGALTAPNGHIYAVAFIYDKMVKVDISNNTVEEFGQLPDAPSQKTLGAALSDKGKIYGVPATGQYIYIIDGIDGGPNWWPLSPHVNNA